MQMKSAHRANSQGKGKWIFNGLRWIADLSSTRVLWKHKYGVDAEVGLWGGYGNVHGLNPSPLLKELEGTTFRQLKET